MTLRGPKGRTVVWDGTRIIRMQICSSLPETAQQRTSPSRYA